MAILKDTVVHGDMEVDGSVDTGNGATKIYDMNQNLKTTDSPIFAAVTTNSGNVDTNIATKLEAERI